MRHNLDIFSKTALIAQMWLLLLFILTVICWGLWKLKKKKKKKKLRLQSPSFQIMLLWLDNIFVHCYQTVILKHSKTYSNVDDVKYKMKNIKWDIVYSWWGRSLSCFNVSIKSFLITVFLSKRSYKFKNCCFFQ